MTVERRYVPPSSLYLDQNPLLFFTLRGIDFEPLIGRTVDQKLEMMLANAYHFNIFSMLSRSVKRNEGVSVTMVSQPMFSHMNISPMLAAIIPQYSR